MPRIEERLARLGLVLPAPIKVPQGVVLPFQFVRIVGSRAPKSEAMRAAPSAWPSSPSASRSRSRGRSRSGRDARDRMRRARHADS